MVEPTRDLLCRPHGRPVRVDPGSEPQATRPTVSDRAHPDAAPDETASNGLAPMGWPRSDPAPWHRLPARSRVRKAEAEIKDLPDRLFSHRHHGNSFGRRAIPPVRRNCQSSKDAFVGRHRKAENLATAQCLGNPAAALRYRIHIALIDQEIGMPLVRVTMAKGVQLANRPQDRRAMAQFPGSGREEAHVKHRAHIQPIAFAEKTKDFFKRQSDRGAEPLGRGR